MSDEQTTMPPVPGDKKQTTPPYIEMMYAQQDIIGTTLGAAMPAKALRRTRAAAGRVRYRAESAIDNTAVADGSGCVWRDLDLRCRERKCPVCRDPEWKAS